MNFTTSKVNDSVKLATDEDNSYTRVDINTLNADEENIPYDRSFNTKEEDVLTKTSLSGEEQGAEDEITELRNNSPQLDWSKKKFPNFPTDSTLTLMKSFRIKNSSTATAESRSRPGSIASSINQFIYRKFAKPHQVDKEMRTKIN